MRTIEHIFERIEAKKAAYLEYNFEEKESDAFKTFFDLAQELDQINDFYDLCVAIPKGFFDLEARLYLISPREGEFMLITSTDYSEHLSMPVGIPEGPISYTADNSLLLSIRGKDLLLDQLPFRTTSDVIGIMEIYPAEGLTRHFELFLEKYANRIGFNLHNRLLVQKNIEHLRFIRTLVADIEHNIIAPNIVYKLYIKNLGGAIARNLKVEELLRGLPGMERGERQGMEDILSELTEVNRTLRNELKSITRHHRNMSLFLEALLRRSHFDQGRLTLRTKECDINKAVIEPQLERFADRFESMGISTDDRLSGVPDEETVNVVDVGLMAQVYANLFSNALKYTEEITTHSGKKKKYVSYGHEVIGDYFGEGKDGVKYNVYTTGPHISPEEREKIFEDQYRGGNIMNQPGSGHGLAFIKNVVEIHGGVVGYEPTQYGNNFYFILPAGR